MSAPSLSSIPAVEKVLVALGRVDLPRPVVTAVVRRELSALRLAAEVLELPAILSRVRDTLDHLRRDRIQPVINGTGIVIHTNLGRSPLGSAVAESLNAIATNYSNLEFDLNAGERGRRGAYLEHNLALLSGAESATVVNNCAAALILILRRFTTKRREVIISRGELVQIGGGFRIPDILEASGAKLREVGTTNQTSVEDYAQAIGAETGLILKVHRSNFFMGGFVASPSTEAIARVARAKRVPFVEDLGSGAIVRTEKLASIEHEPTPAEVLKRGVDLVCFSGDKLLGGPQAGLIAGKKRHIAALKRDPFFRALRCDKLILTALQTTVDHYLAGEMNAVPTLGVLRLSCDELRRRAESLVAQLSGLPLRASVGSGKSQVGGGTLPQASIPSITVDLAPQTMTPDELSTRLRHGAVPVIGYIASGRLKLDLRTVFPQQDDDVVRALHAVCGPSEYHSASSSSP